MPTPKIRVSDLNFFYGSRQALKGVSVSFPANQVTAIIGASGCGKSTLLRVLNRIYSMYPGQRASGTVMIDGQNILETSHDINSLRARVGMVFQAPTPFSMSIYENIAVAVRHHEDVSRSEMDERVESSLRSAALWDEVGNNLRKSALALSGGQKQRLCIARAIAINPEVLLLDEPTASLDPTSTLKIEDLVAELKTRYTIVMVTHNMQQAARASDYTAYMHAGEMREFGETKELFVNPKARETQDYITGRFG